MSVVVKGEGLVKRPNVFRWTRDQGSQTGMRWEGTLAKIAQLRKDLVQDGGADSVETDFNGAKHVLTAWFSDESETGQPPSQQERVDIWELDTNEVERPLEQHPNFASIEDARKAQIINLVESDPVNAAGQVFQAVEVTFRALLLKGIRSFPAEEFVLRHTIITPWRSTVKASFEGVGTVTTDPLSGHAVNPSSTVSGGAKFALPAGEWLKRAPNVRRMGKRKFEIAQELWWALKWPASLYPGGTGTP